MSSANMRRSQVLLRMPVDHVNASMILHDGERSEVVLFIPPTEDIGRVIASGDPFLPILRNGKSCIVARDAIACLGVEPVVHEERHDALPIDRQQAIVKLRSGAMIEGELRWTAPAGQQRTADHLNRAGAYLEVHARDLTYYVVTAHIATVEER